MAKLPGPEDLGGLPQAAGGRPIAGYDTSPFAQGGQALARGTERLGAGLGQLGAGMGQLGQGEEKLGQGLGQAGAGMGDLQQAQAHYQFAQANADFVTKRIDLDASLEHDQDYATLPQRYREAVTQLQQNSAQQIGNPAMRDLFIGHSNEAVAQGVKRSQDQAFRLEGETNVASAAAQGDKFIDQAVATDDDATHQQIIGAHSAQIDALVGKGYINPIQAQAMKTQWAEKYATADALAAADRGPDAIKARITELQGAGHGPLGNINVVYQGPLDKPATKGSVAPKAMYDFLTSKGATPNEATLITAAGASESGLNPNDIHDGGIGYGLFGHNKDRLDAMRDYAGVGAGQRVPWQSQALFGLNELRSRPEAALVNSAQSPEQLAKAEMEFEQPQGYTSASPESGHNYTGRLNTLRRFAALSGGDEVPQQAPAANSIYGIIPPVQRFRLLGHLEGALHKANADDLATFKRQVDDSTEEAMRTGEATNPLGAADFTARLGPEAGGAAFKSYQANLQFGRDAAGVAQLDPDKTQSLIDSYAPKAGPGYADQAKRQDALIKAVSQVAQERGKDPAAFAIQRLPVVKEAYDRLSTALSDPAAAPEALKGAAADYVAKTTMEQQRVGVPTDQIQIVPKGYVEALTRRLTTPSKAGGPLNVAGQLEHEAQVWGPAWPQVYRQLGKDAEPLVRVIGSGVKPQAAQLLTDNYKLSTAEILKQQDEEKVKDFKTAVLDAFKPFGETMVGNDGAMKAFDDFHAQGEKLAALYVARGMKSDEAAAKAYDDLVGHKYTFQDGYRIPKDTALDPAAIRAGAAEAKDKLGELGIAPARDNVGGLTADYLKGETAAAYRRDGKWVTAPDESGLALIYNGMGVRREDGRPLVLPWAQLSTLAQQRRAAAIGPPRGPAAEMMAGALAQP